MQRKMGAHALPFLGDLGSDLTRTVVYRGGVCVKGGCAVDAFLDAAVDMRCFTLFVDSSRCNESPR
jgi:hypothetical protein